MVENLVPYFITGAITLGTAYGGVRVGMNGINKRLDGVGSRLDKLEEKSDTVIVQVAKMEAKLEFLE